jgi:predicted RNA binding protein YcfA (HicA-like mRNA interferase family)
MMVIPAVTAKQMQKVLVSLDWKVIHEYGAYQYYRSDEFPKRLITLPLYDEGDLPLKVLVHILDTAELNFAELVWFM